VFIRSRAFHDHELCQAVSVALERHAYAEAEHLAEPVESLSKEGVRSGTKIEIDS
jgi:hypothetical protein